MRQLFLQCPKRSAPASLLARQTTAQVVGVFNVRRPQKRFSPTLTIDLICGSEFRQSLADALSRSLRQSRERMDVALSSFPRVFNMCCDKSRSMGFCFEHSKSPKMYTRRSGTSMLLGFGVTTDPHMSGELQCQHAHSGWLDWASCSRFHQLRTRIDVYRFI